MAIFLASSSCGLAKVSLHYTNINKAFFEKEHHQNNTSFREKDLPSNPSSSVKMERYISLFLPFKCERKFVYNSRFTLASVDERTFRNGASKLKATIKFISKHRAQGQDRVAFLTPLPLIIEKLNLIK